ncbi:hypothetical protein R69746_04108 [Paraburkholderia aspalathi]|nr:hypothetical protein R69746_04108 [Paraburkholderia aspalathi]
MLQGRFRRCTSVRRQVLYRLGQRRAVDLAVACQRQRVEQTDGCGHQRCRQAGGERIAQLLRIERVADRVADQAHPLLQIRTADHHGVAHTRQRAQLRGHFGGFDAIAANFQLIVDAAEEFKLTVVEPARLIAGAIDARAGHERIGHESTGGERRLLPIAARQRDTARVDFATSARQGGMTVGVEQIDARVIEWAAKRQPVIGAAFGRHDADGRLGRSIVAKNGALGLQQRDTLEQCTGAGFSTQQQRALRQYRVRIRRMKQAFEMARRDLEQIGRMRAAPVGVRVGIEGMPIVDQLQGPARPQRRHQGRVAEIGGRCRQIRGAANAIGQTGE